MLTSLFKKDKPFMFLAVAFYILVIYVFYVFFNQNSSYSFSEILIKIAIFFLLIFIFLMTDFIGRKNNISKLSSYKIVLFALVIAMLPQTFFNEQIVVSALFILLATRRMISMRTQIEVQKKIFDASLWISLASCFYFWSVSYFVMLFASIIIHTNANYKLWLTPFLGMGTVILLSNVYTLLVQNAFYLPIDWVRPYGFDFESYFKIKIATPILILLALTFWAVIQLYLQYRNKNLKSKQTVILIFISLVISCAIVVFTPVKQVSEWLFFIAPFSLLMSIYFEAKNQSELKESISWILFLLPFLVFFL